MSISTSLDVKLTSKGNKELSILEVLECLLSNSWMLSKDNKVTYLPKGDDGDYNWISEVADESIVYKIISDKLKGNENIGIILHHIERETGMQLLYFGKNEVSFNLSINTQYKAIQNHLRVIDANWYLMEIARPLSGQYYLEALNIEQFGS